MAQESRDASALEDPDASDDHMRFLIGQDHSGNWVVTETHGLCGGLFCSKDAAVRFAKFESADRLGSLAITSDCLEFAARR